MLRNRRGCVSVEIDKKTHASPAVVQSDVPVSKAEVYRNKTMRAFDVRKPAYRGLAVDTIFFAPVMPESSNGDGRASASKDLTLTFKVGFKLRGSSPRAKEDSG